MLVTSIFSFSHNVFKEDFSTGSLKLGIEFKDDERFRSMQTAQADMGG